MEERDKKRGKHGEREGKKEDGWMDRQADVTFLITLQMDCTDTSGVHESVGSTLLFKQDLSLFAIGKVLTSTTRATCESMC